MQETTSTGKLTALLTGDESPEATRAALQRDFDAAAESARAAADRREEKAAFAAREREQEREAFASDPDYRRGLGRGSESFSQRRGRISAHESRYPSADSGPTEKQLGFLRALASERDWTAIADGDVDRGVELAARLAARLDGTGEPLTKRAASTTIEWLLSKPKAAARAEGVDGDRLGGRNVVALPEVEPGYYALRPADGPIKFYRVDTPNEGRWSGWTFLSALASDERWPIKARDEKRRILGEIAADPIAAQRLYGQEIGSCGRCGRTLTDETSRAFGIGPDCRKIMGV